MRYTLLEEIGRGGMGCVYKGVDSTGRTVALKMMSNKVTCYPEYRNLFQSEVDTLRRLNHPSVVHIVGDPYQDSAGNLILPMEFVEGETLEHYIARNGVIPPDEAATLMCKILEVMQYVHDRQKIHRDIKPSNIMLRPDGSVCMIDFGIAKDAKIGTGNTVGRIIGTDGYMSPEQANGLNIDTRTDIYSLGCVMYYMLTGKNAIQKGSNDYETINTILRFKVLPPSSVVPGVPAYIDKAVMKAMDKNMTLRYQSAKDFQMDLMGGDMGGILVPRVSVGSSSDNDIIVHNEYVSRHHLLVNGVTEPDADGNMRYFLELVDNSTNGTGVDGRPLRHASMRIEYDGTASLPQVLLAARAECPVDWNQVVGILKQRGWNPQKQLYPLPPQPPSDTGGDGLNPLLAVVSFLIPVAGWIMWGVWHSDRPARANLAGLLGIAGFVVNLLMILIIMK